MKKLFYSLAGCLFLLTFVSCSDEDGDIKMPPPSKGEKSVEEIIKVLEEQVDEASDFVEMLKTVDVTNLEEDELTVFAVRNTTPGTRASSAVLDSVSIKRHIAKGSYSKEQLTDGQKLESISGDTLYISQNANNVYVNGIQIEGEAIPAGNSYIYVVPEVLPTQDTPDVPSVQAYTTTIRVMDITGGVDNPVPMDSVMIQTMEGDSLGSSEFVPTGTDMIMGGEIVIHHTSSVLEFQIAKAGYSNLENGYLLSAEGFTMDDGNFYPYTDLNGDGILNSDDRVDGDTFTYSAVYSVASADGEQVCYMKRVQEVAQPTVDEIETAWNSQFQQYLNDVVEVESLLCGTDSLGNFNYQAVKQLSNTFWNKAYDTLDEGEQALEQLASLYPEESDLPVTIRLEMGIIRTQLYGFYGKVASGEESVYNLRELTDILELLEQQLPSTQKAAAQLLLGKMFAYDEQWTQAQEYCYRLINDAQFALDDYPQTVFNQLDSREIIWGGIRAVRPIAGNYLHPLLYREVLILEVIAALRSSNIAMAVDSLNRLKTAFGEEPVTQADNATILAVCEKVLPGTGALYPYYRILGGTINVSGFTAPTNHLLPIPQAAMNTNPSLMQNPGY